MKMQEIVTKTGTLLEERDVYDNGVYRCTKTHYYHNGTMYVLTSYAGGEPEFEETPWTKSEIKDTLEKYNSEGIRYYLGLTETGIQALERIFEEGAALPQTRIKNLRTACGMSQREFSEFFGVPKRTLENWEAGERVPPDYVIDLIKYKAEKEGLKNNGNI